MSGQDIGPYALALAALLVVAFPGPGRRRLDAVRRRHTLPAGVCATQLLEAYLRRTRRGRAFGVMLAAGALPFLAYAWFAVAVLADTVTGSFAPFAPAVLLLGYLVGSALSEVTWSSPPTGDHRAATLVVRSMSTYLPGWVTALQRALAGLAVVLVAALTLLVQQAPQSPLPLVRSAGWGIAITIAVVAAAMATELGGRRILARPQSWTALETVRVDDVVRAWSQRNLAAAGLGVQLMLLGQLAIQVLLRLAEAVHHPGFIHRVDAVDAVVGVILPVAVIALLWRRLQQLPLGAPPGLPDGHTAARSAMTGPIT